MKATPAAVPLTELEIRGYYAARVKGLHAVGGKWRAPCPLHHGQRDSFAVDPDTGAWFCHSQCNTGGGIYDFEIALTGASLPAAREAVLRAVGRATPEIVATYDYTDEAGKLLYQTVRYRPKDFKQRQPDGRGGWIWNLKGVRRVLYRLPEVIEAQVVWVCEGEKDCDALASLGLVATTNPLGAGKWRPEYSRQLAGKQVNLSPDGDDAGRAHVDKILRSLNGGSARIVELPGAKDAAEWIAKGGTRAELDELAARAAPPTSKLAAPASAGRTDWMAELAVTEKGKIQPTLENAQIALSAAPEWQGVLAWNAFALRMESRAASPWSAPGALWRDVDDLYTCVWLQQHGVIVGDYIAGKAAYGVAHQHPFHPVRRYLDGLRWDGVARIDGWLETYLGARIDEDEDEGDADEDAAGQLAYMRAVAARWLISAVARIYQPGCQVDHTLILEGPQGDGKSSAFQVLAGEEFFTDDMPDLSSKDAALACAGKWILELSELDALSKAEISRIKGFLSRRVDRYRPPYGRHLIEASRQCVFAGTVNSARYLKDESGGRRFWPVACGRIELAALARDRDQLWAEARSRYQRGEKWWLDTRSLVKTAEREQDARFQAHPWESLIEEWLGKRPPHLSEFTTADVLTLAVHKDTGCWDRGDESKVGAILQKLGWKSKRGSSATRRRVYVRARPEP